MFLEAAQLYGQTAKAAAVEMALAKMGAAGIPGVPRADWTMHLTQASFFGSSFALDL